MIRLRKASKEIRDILNLDNYFTVPVCIGNHMNSRAIWEIIARVMY